MMRLLRLLIPIVAAVCVIAMVCVFIMNRSENDAPVITSVSGKLSADVKCDVTDKELLKLVTASDKQDGDITDKITVQKKLFFTEKGVAGATFAVCDSDNNVSKLGITLNYKDYASPKIELIDDLVVNKRYDKSFIGSFKVTDMLDGDITDRLKVISSDFNSSRDGKYAANCKVANSYGDTVDLNIDIIVSNNLGYADILLNQYILYVPVGTQPDFASYLKEVVNEENHNYKVSDVAIDDSEYKASKAGVYNIFYELKSGDNVAALSRLVVVVGNEEE